MMALSACGLAPRCATKHLLEWSIGKRANRTLVLHGLFPVRVIPVTLPAYALVERWCGHDEEGNRDARDGDEAKNDCLWIIWDLPVHRLPTPVASRLLRQ